MKKLQFSAIFFSLILTVMFFPHFGLADTVGLSVSSMSNNRVQINVNGDSNYSVDLFYQVSPSSPTIPVGSIGTTDSSGYFSAILNSGSYNLSSGYRVYVEVNGQQSNTVIWPSSDNNNNDQITFSQNNIELDYNQSITVNIYGGSGSYYISSNSNSDFVNASISGNQIYLSTDNNNQYNGDSATIRVCSRNGNSSCGYLYVTQSGNNNNEQVSFSQNNINLNIGQQVQTTIYGSGSYYISNNSNSNVVNAYLNGNTLNITGSQSGSATIRVCSNNSNSSCGNLHVSVSGNYYNNNNGYYNNPPIVYVQNPTTPMYTQSIYGGLGTPSAGVFLSHVPSTGISFNLKMALFFIGLFMWSAFGAFMILSYQESKKLLADLEKRN